MWILQRRSAVRWRWRRLHAVRLHSCKAGSAARDNSSVIWQRSLSGRRCVLALQIRARPLWLRWKRAREKRQPADYRVYVSLRVRIVRTDRATADADEDLTAIEER